MMILYYLVTVNFCDILKFGRNTRYPSCCIEAKYCWIFTLLITNFDIRFNQGELYLVSDGEKLLNYNLIN